MTCVEARISIAFVAYTEFYLIHFRVPQVKIYSKMKSCSKNLEVLHVLVQNYTDLKIWTDSTQRIFLCLSCVFCLREHY